MKKIEKKARSLKEAVRVFLTKKELLNFRRAFDTVGDIAILEIPKELEPKEKKIAQTLIDINKNIKVVVKKLGAHKGVCRLQKTKILAGERRKFTIHKENGYFIKIHIDNCYFSPRLGTERLRIANRIVNKETVLVMFCGASPYLVVLAKKSNAKEIYGVEINEEGHKLGLENLKLNKIENKCKLFQGDVRDILPKFTKKFDRILMPLPKGGESFISLALEKIKNNGVIHYYDFLHESEFDLVKEKIKIACDSHNYKFELLNIVRCGQQSARTYRICADFKVFTKNKVQKSN